MRLEEALKNRSSNIIKKWQNKIIESYPQDTQRFLKKERDRFANPVGYIINHEIENLYNAFLNKDKEKLYMCLDNIIRIRAVQDFTPSSAVYFVLQLKDIIREEIGDFKEYSETELNELENRINSLLLMAFDIYEQCRYKLYEIRVNEVRGQVSALLKRANLIYEIPEEMRSEPK